MGTPDFAARILEKLFQTDYEIVAVVTQPDRPVGRKKVLTPTPVKEVAIQHGVTVLQPEKLSQSLELEELLAMDIDLIITAAYGQFLPQVLLNHAKIDAVNVHASLLPKYRGAAPIHYAVMNGDTHTGVTIMRMIKQMDAGDMFARQSLEIQQQDTTGTLFEKLSHMGATLLMDTLPALIERSITPQPQDEKQVSFAPAITREQEQINWYQPAYQVHNFIRGLCPFPVAYTLFEGNRYKIWQTELSLVKTDKPTVTIHTLNQKQVFIARGDVLALEVKTIQPAGKGKMSVQDFYNGFKEWIANEPQFESSVTDE